MLKLRFKVIRFFGSFSKRTRALVETCLVGLVAGLAAVAFQKSIAWVFKIIFNQDHWHSLPEFILGSLALILVLTLVSGILLTFFCPEAAGSGIPQIKLSFWKNFGHSPPHIAIVKFLAGVIGIGGGLSLGREGPSVQIGGNLGSTVAGLLGVSKQGKRAAMAAGSAAALAAAFNAPLAGVAFILEEVLEDLNSNFIGSILLASVIGAITVHALIGPDPAFHLPFITEPTWRSYLLMPLVAILASLIGVGFQRATLNLRLKMKSISLPAFLRPMAGALLTWILGMTVFLLVGKLGVFGIGYDDLSDALNQKLTWGVAFLLLFAKWMATVACYGSGGSGGVFSPCLFFGAMCGIVTAGTCSSFLGFTNSDRILLEVVGMSACLGAVVQAPVTSTFIIFEMTHQFALLPGLSIAAILSQFVARKVLKENFYLEILTQDGHHMEHIIPPRDLHSWQKMPVSSIASFEPVTFSIDDLNIREVLDSCLYERFPVFQGESFIGVLERDEAEVALKENRKPQLQHAPEILPGESIRKAEHLLIESPTGMLVVTSKPQGKPLAVLTLHDLLRAQLMITEQA